MRIILADHYPTTMWALRMMLQEEPGMEIVGEVVDARGLKMAAETANADLILMEKNLPDCEIAALISELHAIEPRPLVVVMSSLPEDSRWALRAGADAFVSKGDQPDWLLETLRQYAKKTQARGKAA